MPVISVLDLGVDAQADKETKQAAERAKAVKERAMERILKQLTLCFARKFLLNAG